MIKKTLYPKTTRFGKDKERPFQVTEKLDGSNLGFFVKDDILHIAQRNWVFTEDELDKNLAYKGLIGWLETNGKALKDSLADGSIIFGEWIGMGQIKHQDLDKKFYMFAKGRFSKDDESLINLRYDVDLMQYAFKEQTIPSFIGTVPLVSVFTQQPTLEDLDQLYAETVNRPTEGFIVCDCSTGVIRKYVRLKNGTLTEHQASVK